MNNDNLPQNYKERIRKDAEKEDITDVYFCSEDRCNHMASIGRPCIYLTQHSKEECNFQGINRIIKLIKFEYEGEWKSKW
jgi:hypothetical protein